MQPVYPYVYLATNKNTNHFYIGMRSANKVLSEKDLGIVYFTSNKQIQSNSENYNFTIIAHFFDWESAFLYENNLIKDNWGNPLLMNKHYQLAPSSFSMKGFSRPDLAIYNKHSKQKPKEFREYECTLCRDTFYKEEFIHHHRQFLPFCCQSCAASYNGKTSTHPMKGKTFKRNIPAWNKGISNPLAAENARKGAKKLSEFAKGRKRKYLPDGTWTWEYVKDF